MLMLVCSDEGIVPIIGIIKAVLQLIQILVPIGLIIFGTIDLGKAVIASDEKKIQEGQKTLMKRAVAAVLVFLVATIVSFLMGFIGSDTWQECWKGSTKCKDPNPITGECCSAYDHDDNANTDLVDWKYDSNSGSCVAK